MTAEEAPDVRIVARISLRRERAAPRARAPVFHVFAEMYARSRTEAARASEPPAAAGAEPG